MEAGPGNHKWYTVSNLDGLQVGGPGFWQQGNVLLDRQNSLSHSASIQFLFCASPVRQLLIEAKRKFCEATGKQSNSTPMKQATRKDFREEVAFFFFFWSYHTACGILVSQQRIEPRPLAVKTQSLSHPGRWLLSKRKYPECIGTGSWSCNPGSQSASRGREFTFIKPYLHASQ